jgi:hypothetical protein
MDGAFGEELFDGVEIGRCGYQLVCVFSQNLWQASRKLSICHGQLNWRLEKQGVINLDWL